MDSTRTDLSVGTPLLMAADCAPVSKADVLREKLNASLPLLVFLGFYFVATVLGNFIYHTNLGEDWARSAVLEADFSDLPLMRTPGYWVLLLMPFLIVPPLAIYSARVMRTFTDKAGFLALEFRRSDYLVITGVAYAYCYYKFHQANVTEIMRNTANDVYGSVAARFEIVETLGFWPLMVMKSVLIFLAVYSLVRAIRLRERFWIIAFLVNLILLSGMLIRLNMKWPLLIYYIALMLCIFLFSRQHPYRKAIISAVGLGVAYLVISVVVLRYAEAEIASQQIYARPAPGPSLTPRRSVRPKPENSLKRQEALPTGEPINTSDYVMTVAQKAVFLAPVLTMNALNRMALPYPFYYQVFTERGQICGTIMDRIQRKKNPCHPSNVIYEEIYGKDPFGGKATAPAAVHV